MLKKQYSSPTDPSKEDQQSKVLTVRAILPWMVLMLLLIMLPYFAAWITTPPAHQFMGSIINAYDTSVYLSAMRQGQEGAWLFQYTFSAEPISPAFIYFPYIATGHLLRLLDVSVMMGFYSLYLIGSVLVMFSLLHWVRVIFPRQRRMQLTVWLLIVFGSGLGWLMLVLFQLPIGALPDLTLPEWSLFLTMSSAPHFSFGLAAQILFFASVVQMMRGKNGRFYVIIPIITAFLLGLFYAFNLLVISITLAVYVLIRTVQARRVLWADWINSFLIAIPVLPLLYYYGVWVQQDATWKLIQSTNNVIAPPSPLFVVVALGLLAPLAFIGSIRLVKEHRDLLPLIWGVVTLALIYAPVPYSGRFLMGLAVPVGTLAGFGLETAVLPALSRKKIYTIIQKYSPTPYDTIRRLILILTIPSGIMSVAILFQFGVTQPDYPLYLPEADVEAALWFSENSNADSLIMSGHAMGNYLPRVSNSHVFIGQLFLTVDYDEKLEQSTLFWQADSSPAWREELIQTWDISYIYYGTMEKKITDGHDLSLPGHVVYDKDGVLIFDVRHDGRVLQP